MNSTASAAPDPMFRRGDFVHVTFQFKTLPAMVTLASSDGRFLILMFEGMLGDFPGALPLAWSDGEYRDLVQERIAVITPALHDAEGPDVR